MRQLISFTKKFALVTLILAVGLAVIPSSAAFAAGLPNGTTPLTNEIVSNVRLEEIWARSQRVYDRQGFLLSLTNGLIAKVQNLIDRAEAKGWDTSAIQTALNAFDSVIPAANAAHLPGAAIIASHDGFNLEGMVTDRNAAIETVKSLVQVLKYTRTVMNGTGLALRDALKTFRDAHPSNQVTPTP